MTINLQPVTSSLPLLFALRDTEGQRIKGQSQTRSSSTIIRYFEHSVVSCKRVAYSTADNPSHLFILRDLLDFLKNVLRHTEKLHILTHDLHTKCNVYLTINTQHLHCKDNPV